MAVAKSYENMQILGEPFDREGKLYVRVRGACQRCGGSGHYSYNQMDGTKCYGCNGSGKATIAVRWYTDKERANMDRAADRRAVLRAEAAEKRRIQYAPYNKYGFNNGGYIYILKGDTKIINEWAHETTPCQAKYSPIFGWYMTAAMATDKLPSNVSTIKVNWEDVKNPDDSENLMMKDDAEVIEYIKSLKYEPSKSEYQGNPGQNIDRIVTIKKVIPLNSVYGRSLMYILQDANENVYVWNTQKEFEENGILNMRMKVKTHKEYNGTKQTVVYYCKVKEYTNEVVV